MVFAANKAKRFNPSLQLFSKVVTVAGISGWPWDAEKRVHGEQHAQQREGALPEALGSTLIGMATGDKGVRPSARNTFASDAVDHSLQLLGANPFGEHHKLFFVLTYIPDLQVESLPSSFWSHSSNVLFPPIFETDYSLTFCWSFGHNPTVVPTCAHDGQGQVQPGAKSRRTTLDTCTRRARA